MKNDLYQIIYLSTAEPGLSEEALLEILAVSQERNAVLDITGLLLHSDGNIIQIIEGPESSVKELYCVIAQDSRHRSVMEVSSKSIEARDFPDFRMGFKRAWKRDFESYLPFFSQIVDDGYLSAEELKGASKLVTIFLKTFIRSTNLDRFGNNFPE